MAATIVNHRFLMRRRTAYRRSCHRLMVCLVLLETMPNDRANRSDDGAGDGHDATHAQESAAARGERTMGNGPPATIINAKAAAARTSAVERSRDEIHPTKIPTARTARRRQPDLALCRLDACR